MFVHIAIWIIINYHTNIISARNNQKNFKLLNRSAAGIYCSRHNARLIKEPINATIRDSESIVLAYCIIN